MHSSSTPPAMTIPPAEYWPFSATARAPKTLLREALRCSATPPATSIPLRGMWRYMVTPPELSIPLRDLPLWHLLLQEIKTPDLDRPRCITTQVANSIPPPD